MRLNAGKRTSILVLSLVVGLFGCSSGSNAILQTLPYAYGEKRDVDSLQLDPNFRYLRVTVGGRVVLLALGDVDMTPQGPIEVWYSAEREVLRLQNGRLAGAVGLTTEWRHVSIPALPSWAEIARGADDQYHWTRIRDVMPGYRYGVKDFLTLYAIEPPPRTALKKLDKQKLKWFEERFDPESEVSRGRALLGNARPNDSIPPARYAVELGGGAGTVVYGEQCLSSDLCFTWQRWPVQASDLWVK